MEASVKLLMFVPVRLDGRVRTVKRVCTVLYRKPEAYFYVLILQLCAPLYVQTVARVHLLGRVYV